MLGCLSLYPQYKDKFIRVVWKSEKADDAIQMVCPFSLG